MTREPSGPAPGVWLRPGPWGRLEALPIVLEPPVEYLTPELAGKGRDR